MLEMLIPAAANVLGGILGNSSSSKAQKAMVQQLQKGADTINQYYNEGKGYLDPYWNTGIIANTGIQKLLGGDYSGFYNSPDFQAAMQGGRDMLDNSAAARGGLFGGGQQRALTNYGQQLASQYLGNYRNWLGNTANAGQSAGAGIGQLGAAAGQNLASLYGQQGQAMAQGASERGANLGNMVGSIGRLFGNLF